MGALYKEDGIEDAKFVRLKTETRHVWTAIVVLIAAVVGIIVLGSMVLVVGRVMR